MMAELITPEDLEPFADIDQAKAEAMIADAVALATQLASCLGEDDVPKDKRDAAKAILRRAILRWNQAGTGAWTQQSAGPMSVTVDSRSTTKSNMFTAVEEQQLQALCPDAGGGAFTIDTMPKREDPDGIPVW